VLQVMSSSPLGCLTVSQGLVDLTSNYNSAFDGVEVNGYHNTYVQKSDGSYAGFGLYVNGKQPFAFASGSYASGKTVNWTTDFAEPYRGNGFWFGCGGSSSKSRAFLWLCNSTGSCSKQTGIVEVSVPVFVPESYPAGSLYGGWGAQIKLTFPALTLEGTGTLNGAGLTMPDYTMAGNDFVSVTVNGESEKILSARVVGYMYGTDAPETSGVFSAEFQDSIAGWTGLRVHLVRKRTANAVLARQGSRR
jgi:hypothetical protein